MSKVSLRVWLSLNDCPIKISIQHFLRLFFPFVSSYVRYSFSFKSPLPYSTTFCILFTVICNDFLNATESWKLLLHFLSLCPSLIFHITSQLQLSHILHKVGYANQTKSPAPIIQFRSANYDLCKWIELELLVGRIEKQLHCTAVDVVFSINNLDVPCRFMAPPSAAKDDDQLHI